MECTRSEARPSNPVREGDSVKNSMEAKREEEPENSPEGVKSSQGEEIREASPEGDDWVTVGWSPPVLKVRAWCEDKRAGCRIALTRGAYLNVRRVGRRIS